MFTEDQRIGYIVEANKRALASNGASDVTAELRKMAQGAGMDLADAERQMGYQPGVLTGGSAQPAQQANLGMGGQNATLAGYNPATQGTIYDSPQQSTVTPLSAADRDSWIGRFDSQAKAQGKSVGQVMYEYAKQNNLSNADVDKYMGYNSGTAQSWVDQNIGSGGGGVAAGGGAGGSSNLGMGGGGGSSNLGLGTITNGGNQSGGVNPNYPGVNNANPYLTGMGRDIGNQLADTWNRQILPGTRSSAIAAGGFGGSRQGVVEANALNDLGKNYVSGLTNLYGTDYTNAQNRGLQQRGMDQSYDLGLRNNDLGFSNLDYQINQGNFSNNLQAANFGLGVQDYMMRNNLTGIDAGTNLQDTALRYQKDFNQAGINAGGAGGTRTGTTTT